MTPKIQALLRLAYSAERAAAYAYCGHAASVNELIEKEELKKIEDEEWEHREFILNLMNEYDISVSRWLEIKYFLIGKTISLSCHVIGWFMPMYFAGRLESGNVNEYIYLKNWFNEIGVYKHDECLLHMAEVEKEHEIYFLNKISNHHLTFYFSKLFKWGPGHSFNNLTEEIKERIPK